MSEQQSGRSASQGKAGTALRLLLLGDCMLGRLVNEVLENASPQYPWGDTLPILHGADWRLCNLECVISDRGTPWSAWPKAFHFRSAAKNVAVLEAAKINAVSLANNHVLNYGYDAMFEMLAILDRAQIAHAGAGANKDEASQFAVSEVCGQRIGLLAFTDNEPGWEATVAGPGVFYVPTDLNDSRAVSLLELIRKQKAVVDFLVVSAHWGSNWGYEPPNEHIAFAHALIDSGADLIFGHSSHVFRGIEFYKHHLVLYGVGDFLDDYAVDPIERNDQSFIYLVATRNRAIQSVCLYPTLIRRCQVSKASGIHAASINDRMKGLCAALGTSTVWDPEESCLKAGPLAREDRSADQVLHPSMNRASL